MCDHFGQPKLPQALQWPMAVKWPGHCYFNISNAKIMFMHTHEHEYICTFIEVCVLGGLRVLALITGMSGVRGGGVTGSCLDHRDVRCDKNS